MPTIIFLFENLSMISGMTFSDGLTILIPVYKDSEYLLETIKSVINFAPQEFKIVIVGDGPSASPRFVHVVQESGYKCTYKRCITTWFLQVF